MNMNTPNSGPGASGGITPEHMMLLQQLINAGIVDPQGVRLPQQGMSGPAQGQMPPDQMSPPGLADILQGRGQR